MLEELTPEQEEQLKQLVPKAVSDVKATAKVRGEPESDYVAFIRFQPDTEPVCGAMRLKYLDDEFAGHPNMREIRKMIVQREEFSAGRLPILVHLIGERTSREDDPNTDVWPEAGLVAFL